MGESLWKKNSRQREGIDDVPNFCLLWGFLWGSLMDRAPPGRILVKNIELGVQYHSSTRTGIFCGVEEGLK